MLLTKKEQKKIYRAISEPYWRLKGIRLTKEDFYKMTKDEAVFYETINEFYYFLISGECIWARITRDVIDSLEVMLNELGMCDQSEEVEGMKQALKIVFNFDETGKCLGFNSGFVFHHKKVTLQKEKIQKEKLGQGD